MPMVLERFDRWVLEGLPAANREVLAGSATPEDLIASANRHLRELPEPDEVSTREACRTLVSVGIIGSSVGRHLQERDLRLKETPDDSLADLAVGSTAVPFTDYVTRLRQVEAAISMAAVGEPRENGYAERLMRTIKEEEVELTEYQDFADALQQLGRFLDAVYNVKRIHSALGYLTPAEFEQQWRSKQPA